MNRKERRLQHQGNYYFVVIPIDWIRKHNLKQSDKMIVDYNDRHVIIYPKSIKKGEIKNSKS